MFLPTALAKQSWQGKELPTLFVPSFPDDVHLCPVRTLKDYEKRSLKLRNEETRLFIATIKPHKPVTSCSIARWLKALLEEAGVDISIFNPHSLRASSTTAANMRITTNVILKAAGWSSGSVFQIFYYKSIHDPSYGRAVLSCKSST